MVRLKIDSKTKRITSLEAKISSLREVTSIIQQLDPDGWQDWVVESEVEYVPTYPHHLPTPPTYPMPTYSPTIPWTITDTKGSDFDIDIKNNKNN